VTELADALDAPTRAASRPRALPRWVLALVFALGFGHAALYAVTFPPWAIEDEQQHVDYVWKLAHDRRLPTITDEIDYGIVEGIFGTDRFEAYDMARPQPTAESMGLQARSYAAYHPPAAYVALTPVVLVSGERALLALYLLRFVSAVAAGLVAAATALLAVDLARRIQGPARPAAIEPVPVSLPGSGSGSVDDAGLAVASPVTATGAGEHGGAAPGSRRLIAVALAAGVAMAALPALADSGGRVDTDIYAALIVVVGCRVLLRWVDRPDNRTSWLVGAVLTIAVLTRETALVLAIPTIVATAVLLRTQRLDGRAVARAVVAPILVSFAWIAHQWRVSGYLDGSRGFLATYGEILTQPAPRPLTETIGDALLVPFGVWGVPWLVVVALVAIAGAGLVLLARADAPVLASTAAGMLAFVVLALVLAVDRDLNVVTARLLLPAYPAVIAAATVGWSTQRSRWATFALAFPVVAFGTWFAAFELLARFSPRLG
jgi:hypothetical protein